MFGVRIVQVCILYSNFYGIRLVAFHTVAACCLLRSLTNLVEHPTWNSCWWINQTWPAVCDSLNCFVWFTVSVSDCWCLAFPHNLCVLLLPLEYMPQTNSLHPVPPAFSAAMIPSALLVTYCPHFSLHLITKYSLLAVFLRGFALSSAVLVWQCWQFVLHSFMFLFVAGP